MIHLPKGPTIHFKVTNIKLSEDIHHSGRVTDHNPELILNNFNTKIGRRVGRFFASLFPQNPDLRGKILLELRITKRLTINQKLNASPVFEP